MGRGTAACAPRCWYATEQMPICASKCATPSAYTINQLAPCSPVRSDRQPMPTLPPCRTCTDLVHRHHTECSLGRLRRACTALRTCHSHPGTDNTCHLTPQHRSSRAAARWRKVDLAACASKAATWQLHKGSEGSTATHHTKPCVQCTASPAASANARHDLHHRPPRHCALGDRLTGTQVWLAAK